MTHEDVPEDTESPLLVPTAAGAAGWWGGHRLQQATTLLKTTFDCHKWNVRSNLTFFPLFLEGKDVLK